jgi:hypothetical protein
VIMRLRLGSGGSVTELSVTGRCRDGGGGDGATLGSSPFRRCLILLSSKAIHKQRDTLGFNLGNSGLSHDPPPGLLAGIGWPQSTPPDRGLIDDMRPSRRTPTRQRRGQPHDARRSRAWLTWGSSQLPRSLKNLRQNCLRLIVNVDGNLGLVAVPTTQTITPIFTSAGAVRARQWSFGPP